MAYTPTEWETGDVITAAKLNNMETGISNAMVAADAFAPDIDNPANGDVIKYDSTAGKWVNGAVSSGVFPIEANIDAATQAMSLTETWQDIYDAAAAGKLCLIYTADSTLSMAINLYVAMVASQQGAYNVLGIMAQSTGVSVITFSAGHTTDYPTQVL